MNTFENKKQKKHQIIPGMMLAVFLLFFGAPVRGDLYDFYVDAGSSESQENGTENYPFKTITAALDRIRSERLEGKNIYIKKGVYSEEIELTNNSNLMGEDRHETVINGEGKSNGILFHSTQSQMTNLTVEKASVNLKIDKKSKATVENCSIKESGSDGIEADRTSRSKKYLFTFKNSSVKDSGKRGMYIFKRLIEITGNEISGNDEEGIDLHASVKGKISSNTIEGNGESGIEMMIAGASLSIRGNHIISNRSQGLGIQFYNSTKGKAKITKNTIKNNHSYGIRYARYDRGKIKEKFRNFIKKCAKLSRNPISGNGDGDYGYL